MFALRSARILAFKLVEREGAPTRRLSILRNNTRFRPKIKPPFTDAHIAALKAGLKLTQAQEKNWPALEAVLRDVAKARAARMAEWHEKAKERHEHPDLIENLRQGAKAMTARAGEMEKIAR